MVLPTKDFENINVLCVRQGTKFSRDYVTVLGRMVKEHLGKDLICLTDQDDTPGITRRLITNHKGWWAKIELFHEANKDLRPCLYLDLDTYILNDCRDLLINPESLYLIRDFYHYDKRSNSGLMLIPKETQEIYRALLSQHGCHGDGDVLTRLPHEKLQDHFEGIKSYKADKDAKYARICCFHGKPKPHETEGWAQEIWIKHSV